MIDREVEMGVLVAHIRQLAGLTQRELAERLGCSQATVAGFEKAGNRLQWATIERIAHAAGFRVGLVLHEK